MPMYWLYELTTTHACSCQPMPIHACMSCAQNTQAKTQQNKFKSQVPFNPAHILTIAIHNNNLNKQ